MRAFPPLVLCAAILAATYAGVGRAASVDAAAAGGLQAKISYCKDCHGPAAQGTTLGPQLRSGLEAFTTVSFATALWRHGPHMIDRAEELGVSWPVLEPSDVGDLVSFLNTSAQK